MHRDGLSPASVSAYLAPVRALFADAVERGDVAASPALRLRINAKVAATRKTKSEEEKTLTRAELAALLRAIPERHRLVFEVLAGTGCRISEALGLEWRDLASERRPHHPAIERQWYRGTLKPNAKTEAGERTIELPPALARRL